MIVSHIIGGLGNQMFQFAAGLALARRNGSTFGLDVRDFGGYGLHNGYELSRVFAGPFVIAGAQEIKQLLGWRDWPLVRRALIRKQLRWARSKSFVVAPQFHYWDKFFDLPDDCYLVGYWQSERYFKGIEAMVREAFTFKNALDSKNSSVAESIAEGTAVSIHIRRGDYLTNRKSHGVHGIVPLAFYERAVEHMVASVRDPRFFVFSDDIDWARKNLRLIHPCHFIGHNRGSESYIDMQLMSMCDHHIIANSSFSWWGAWLNSKPSKIVLYPSRWFATAALDTRDLFPAGWEAL